MLVCLVAPVADGADTPVAGLPKDIKLPNNTAFAYYLPENFGKFKIYLAPSGFWLRPGLAAENGIASTLQRFFSSSFPLRAGDAQAAGLLLDIHPSPTVHTDVVTMALGYKLFSPDGKVLLEGSKSATAATGDLRTGGGIRDASAQATQQIVVEVLTALRPDAARFPAAATIAERQPAALVDHEKPVATGTGFYVNAAGQILTAAHVVDACVLIEAKRDDKVLASHVIASSHLVDLAVLDTGAPSEHHLPVRKNGEVVLGEPIVNVGYPLQSILAASPNLTRGNVSSLAALEGSLGQFQFSAPIQPGSSGGPVVSDRGELVGVTQSTLNAARLATQGVIPQNVNFALAPRYVSKFLRKNGIAFDEVEPTDPGSSERGNGAALAAVLRLACYQ